MEPMGLDRKWSDEICTGIVQKWNCKFDTTWNLKSQLNSILMERYNNGSWIAFIVFLRMASFYFNFYS
ncbi:unnamed protein product [Rotaria socialis]